MEIGCISDTHLLVPPSGIPDGDVLVVHGPPARQLDINVDRDACGCQKLAEAILRIGPRVVVFGHITRGMARRYDGVGPKSDPPGQASICNSDSCPVNRPVVVSLQHLAS